MQANFYDGAIIGQREEQQDDRTNLILAGGYRLYVLADGMGGHRAGQLASKTVCSAFREYFRTNPDIEQPQRALRSALQHANQAVADLLTQQPELKGMGTTVIAVLLHEPSNSFSFISVGDSPLYQFVDDKLTRINANHAFYEQLKSAVAAGAMSQEEADTHPERHAITSAVMGSTIETFDLQSGKLTPNMLLMLASDGVQTLSDESEGEITALLKQHHGSLEKQVNALLAAVEDKGLSHQDNTTVLLIQAIETPEEQQGLATPTTQVELKPTKKHKRRALTLWLILLIVIILALWVVNPMDVQNSIGNVNFTLMESRV